MLGLFGSKSNHPLVDAKEARRICAELAALDPAASLDEAASWLESLAGLNEIPAAVRLKRSLELVTASLPASRRQARDYLANPQLSRLEEQKAWQRNHGYWTQATHALTRCLADADADPKAADTLRPQIGMLLAGLLIAQFGCLRWTQLRYGLIDGAQWAAIGQIYLRATQEKLAERMLTPFGTAADETTVAQEYLKILIFHATSMGSLAPLEIALAERFIAHFLPHFVLSAELRPESVYWVDAGKPLPPTRLAKLPELSPTLRFFGPGQALAAVQELRATIAANKALPPEINLGGQPTPASLLAVLDHLAACWSPQPPTRGFPRHRVKSGIGACVGFSTLHGLLTGTDIDQGSIESWVVEDVSQGGMSVKLPLTRNDWMKIGAMVGIQPEGGANWLVGSIRRFARESETQGAAGVETLSKTPRAVTVTDGALHTDMILLDPLRDDSSIRIVLLASNWEEGVPVQMLVDGRPWRLHPEEILEAEAEWLMGRCIAESLDPR
jgi:hypothetical protein